MASRLAIVLFGTLACSTGVLAQGDGGAPERDHEITLEDYFTQVYVSDMRTAPDGGTIAYIEARWDEDLDRRNNDLWTVDTSTRELRRLTFDPANESKPRWSAKSDWIYFLASRERPGAEAPPYDGEQQVWRIGKDGGEAQPVSRVAEGVLDFALTDDGRYLFYVAARKQVERDAWSALREEFDDLEYGHGVVKFGVLHRLDLQTWRVDKLVDEERVINEFRIAPDGNRVAMVTTPTEELITNEGWSNVDVFDMRTRTTVRIEDRLFRAEAPSPYGWIVEPTWSSDSAKLAFRVDFDGYPGEIFVAHFDGAAAPGVTKIERPDEVTAEGMMRWRPGTDELCFLADDHARARIHSVSVAGSRQGAASVLTPGDVVIEAFDFSRDGRTLAALKGGLTHTADLFLVQLRDSSAPRPGAVTYDRITNLNPQIDRWKLPQIRIVKWKSDDGTDVEGILELPPDYREGDGPLPTVVAIHGGPTSSTKFTFRYWIYGRTLFAAKGWALFDPNYRGSTGYGDKFLTDLINNKNNLDVQDILSGVDMLVSKGIADPDRLAVTGWSNGGYLTNCVITATDRFKAASSGAGVVDTVMQWSIEDTPGHVVNFSGGLPWDRGAKMHETSPLYELDRIVTPTVIHVGAEDERVPVEHSRALHRALHHYLGVPTELVIYPGQGHGLTKYSFRKAKMRWDHAWFDHHVLGRSAGEPAEAAPDS